MEKTDWYGKIYREVVQGQERLKEYFSREGQQKCYDLFSRLEKIIQAMKNISNEERETRLEQFQKIRRKYEDSKRTYLNSLINTEHLKKNLLEKIDLIIKEMGIIISRAN